MDPKLASWSCHRREPDEEGGCCIIVTAYRRTGRYEGDGIYEGGTRRSMGGFTRYHVRLLPGRIDGHRSFDVRTSMDQMILTEPRLDTFIRAKIGGVL